MLPITLNNREIALIIWIGLFSIGLLFHKPIRSSIVDLLKLLFSRAILTLFAILLFYVLVCVFFLHKIEFWDFSFFKDTVIWFFGVAFVLLINSNKANHDDNYFRKIILDNLKLMVILEFFLNLYVFDLYIEMLILPLIIFIVGLGAGAESQKKNVFIKKGTDYLLAIFGFIFMI